MSWEQGFVDAFFNNDSQISDKKKVHRGYWLILRCQRLRFCIQALWELMTTFIVYVPATDIIKTILQGVNARWRKMSAEERECVIVALRRLDKKGDVSVTIKGKL